MVDNINSGNSTTPTNSTTQNSTVAQTNQTELNTQTTSSHIDNTENSPIQAIPNLPIPNEIMTSSHSMFSHAISEKSDALVAALKINQHLDAKDVYLNDTKSLLLMITGIVDNIVAFSSMQSIESGFINQRSQQDKHLSMLKNRPKTESEITQREAEVATKMNDVAGLKMSMSVLEAFKESLSNSLSGEIDPNTIKQTQDALNELSENIASTLSNINTLQSDIEQLQTINQYQRDFFNGYHRFFDNNKTALIKIMQLVEKAKQRFDHAALHTGEQSFIESKEKSLHKDYQINQDDRKREADLHTIKTTQKEKKDESASISISDTWLEKKLPLTSINNSKALFNMLDSISSNRIDTKNQYTQDTPNLNKNQIDKTKTSKPTNQPTNSGIDSQKQSSQINTEIQSDHLTTLDESLVIILQNNNLLTLNPESSSVKSVLDNSLNAQEFSKYLLEIASNSPLQNNSISSTNISKNSNELEEHPLSNSSTSENQVIELLRMSTIIADEVSESLEKSKQEQEIIRRHNKV